MSIEQKYIYGTKDAVELVAFANHLLHHKNETNYPIPQMHKWCHIWQSQTDGEYCAHVDMVLDIKLLATLDAAEKIENYLKVLSSSTTKPSKFVSETAYKETTDKYYIIKKTEDEKNIIIERDTTGKPIEVKTKEIL